MTNIIQNMKQEEKFTVAVREKKNLQKKREYNEEKEVQDYIMNEIQYGQSGSNAGRKDIKQSIHYHIKNKNATIQNMSGIEVKLLEYGQSVNQNEAAHEFLDAQKMIDLVINTNATCPLDTYCAKKEVAICSRAANLNAIKKRLEKGDEKEYTKKMFDKEKWYTIPIDTNNIDFIAKILKQQRDENIMIIENDRQQVKIGNTEHWNKRSFLHFLKEKNIKIDLLQLQELSSNIAKRRAADLIIMHQINIELQKGKLIQYHYHNDLPASIGGKTQTRSKNTDNMRKPILKTTYPRIKEIARDKIGDVVPSSTKFINPGSVTCIDTAQIPANASIFIPSKKNPTEGYMQSITEIAWALKKKDITKCGQTEQQLTEVLNQK